MEENEKLMAEINDWNEENEAWINTRDHTTIKSKYDTEDINKWIDTNIENSNKKFELIDKLLLCFSGMIPFEIINNECLEILEKNQN